MTLNQPMNDAASCRRNFLIACVIYVAFNVLIKFVPAPLRPDHRGQLRAMVLTATAIFMLLQLWLPWTVAVLKVPTLRSVLYAVLFGAGWAAIVFGLAPHAGLSSLQNGKLFHLEMELLPISNMCATCALAFFGSLLSRIVREAKILLPVGVIAGLVDVVGAMMPVGFTANVIAKHPQIVQKVSISVPTIGALQPISLLGPGDALFLGFFFATVVRFAMNLRNSFWLTYVMLTLSMLAVIFSTLPLNIGALLPMGFAMIVANFSHFHYTRAEKFAMLYAGAIVLAGAAAFFLATNRFLFHHR